MNPNSPNLPDPARLESLLADYLAGELPPADVAALKSAAAADPALARRIAELEAARDIFAASAPTPATAELLTASLVTPETTGSAIGAPTGERLAQAQARTALPPWVSGARYAAVILVAFLSGYLARDAAPRSAVPPPPHAVQRPVTVPGERSGEPDAFAADIARNYLEVTRERPQARLFGRALLALARH